MAAVTKINCFLMTDKMHTIKRSGEIGVKVITRSFGASYNRQ